jgi:hypothetical protein
VYCPYIKSLEGLPENVMYLFCTGCENLETLNGAPKKIERGFDCDRCDKLSSLKGGPEEIGKVFKFNLCPSLESLEGFPKKVGGDVHCKGTKFKEEDIRNVCDVKQNVYC